MNFKFNMFINEVYKNVTKGTFMIGIQGDENQFHVQKHK